MLIDTRQLESKKAKIAEVLAYINERLKELESEKEELKEYQQLDRERRALEYCLFDHELKETEAKLSEVKHLCEEYRKVFPVNVYVEDECSCRLKLIDKKKLKILAKTTQKQLKHKKISKLQKRHSKIS
jgi:structural maintenance of chromosome 3 (chondroitin sulfate proteoglycan 6)